MFVVFLALVCDVVTDETRHETLIVLVARFVDVNGRAIFEVLRNSRNETVAGPARFCALLVYLASQSAPARNAISTGVLLACICSAFTFQFFSSDNFDIQFPLE